jgi:hypothetical protein
MKRSCNKLVLRFSIAILLALSASSLASTSGQTRETTKRRLTALVLKVDHEKRTLLVREYGGKTTLVNVPKDAEINLSQNSTTMGRTHLVTLDWMVPGMIINVNVLTVSKLAETADAAPNLGSPRR